jgi:hypothetical protein
MEFVFTIAISGEGENEARAFDDALIRLAEKVASYDKPPSLIKEFSNEWIESREVEDE